MKPTLPFGRLGIENIIGTMVKPGSDSSSLSYIYIYTFSQMAIALL